MVSVSQRTSNAISILLFSTLLFTFAFTVEHLKYVFTVSNNTHEYSFVGKDYPMELPLSLPLVETVFEESTEFTILGPDAKKAWRSLHPKGRGYVHLGPRRRIFAIAMFHQLHCIVAFHTVLSDPEDPTYAPEHVHHCLNYVRQLILCNADQTLEPYDFMSRNFTTDPVGHTRQCRDWSRLYDFVKTNHVEWMDFVRTNLTDLDPCKFALHPASSSVWTQLKGKINILAWWGDKIGPIH